ncbi:hypothetical protein [Streptomyces sp. GbtcB6]|uniref:hypothetical protein n=1 Tax=Streptomyces sp. GbtcB6 TaxID=2824751 RepID=UPI001C30960A|nr:hypothetical protein [Streptomyces sp. GbtcB6]
MPIRQVVTSTPPIPQGQSVTPAATSVPAAFAQVEDASMQPSPVHAHPAGHRRAVAGTCPHRTAPPRRPERRLAVPRAR